MIFFLKRKKIHYIFIVIFINVKSMDPNRLFKKREDRKCSLYEQNNALSPMRTRNWSIILVLSQFGCKLIGHK